jgi:hypothetical protein
MSQESIIAVSLWMILPLGLIGSLLHFLFDWTGHNKFVSLFSAVNESYWEHIKIAFWPTLLLQIVLFAYGGYNYPSFIPAATIALYTLPISMIGLVFLYKMFTKKNVLWIDITVFFVVIAVAQTLFVIFFAQLLATWVTVVFAAVFWLGLCSAFVSYTLRPPQEPDIFIDPTNSKYGMKAHPDWEPK